jgi:hypothetical protein
VPLADLMIMIAQYDPSRTHAMRIVTGVHFPKTVPQAGQTKRAIERLKKQQ